MYTLSFKVAGIQTISFSPTFKMHEKWHNILTFSTIIALLPKAVQKILEVHNKIFHYITLNFFKNAIQNSYTTQPAPW